MESTAFARSTVSIQAEDFDVSAEIDALRAADPRVGAVCCFVGTVRDRNAVAPAAERDLPDPGAALSEAPRPAPTEPVLSMELEHYPGMTEKAIEAMVAQARQRFAIYGARVVHRIGLLRPADQIVLVAVTAAHRGQSFQACEFLMDYLKTQAPFWKKEQTVQGERWVDARVSDDAALARWGITASNLA